LSWWSDADLNDSCTHVIMYYKTNIPVTIATGASGAKSTRAKWLPHHDHGMCMIAGYVVSTPFTTVNQYKC